MRTALDILSRVSIASPCDADWNDMAGDNHVRFCGKCEKNVYNLSALTTAGVLELIREKEGKLCGRYFRRADGTILTADCPIGAPGRVRKKGKRVALAMAIGLPLAAAYVLAWTGAHTQGAMCVDPALFQNRDEPELLPAPRVVEEITE